MTVFSQGDDSIDSLQEFQTIKSMEGILWAHEFGHNKGLRHRAGQSLLMNPTVGPTEKGLNSAESDAFLVQ